jgi:hypothetical protein
LKVGNENLGTKRSYINKVQKSFAHIRKSNNANELGGKELTSP